MFTEQQKHNANLASQAMRVQEVVTKAEFTATVLNSFLHTAYHLVLENQDDVVILRQAQQVLTKINSRDAFDKLVEQTV